MSEEQLIQYEYLAIKNTLIMCNRRQYQNILAPLTIEEYILLTRKSPTNVILFDTKKPMLTAEKLPVLIVVHRPHLSLTKAEHLAVVRPSKDKGRTIDPSGSGIFNQIMKILGIGRESIAKTENPGLTLVEMMTQKFHPIILYHTPIGKLPTLPKQYTFHPETRAPLLDFFPITNLIFDPLDHELQPKIRYLPKRSSEAKALIEHFGTHHPTILSIDPVARNYRAQEGDFIEYRRSDGTIHFRQVKAVDLSATSGPSNPSSEGTTSEHSFSEIEA